MPVGSINVWDQIRTHLGDKLNPESYQNWLAKTSFQRFECGTLYIDVPNQATRAWMEEEYADLVSSTVRSLALPVERMVYQLKGNLEGGVAISTEPPAALNVRALPQSTEDCLNPRFTFDTFVVGSCNQFAHAAARAVASNPRSSYNPLFIYGGVGMGKTHLLHAIGRVLVDQFKDLKIVYTSSERFMNNLIQCIAQHRMPQFHEYYRQADVLLTDDIQVIGGKERTQEEFFHTFNDLYDHQKQIVISSDSPPKEIPGLVERLRSRFEWGLMVDMQPPDLETKIAILDRKAEAEGVSLPDDVRIFIATKTKSNVRELEGALVKLIAFSSVSGAPISLSLAQHCLKHLIHFQEKRITIESIQKVVAEHFQLPPGHLKQKSNTRRITEPRQIAMFLTKELTGASLPEIGRAFGGKHHTTVLHSIQKVERVRHSNPDLNRTIHRLIDSIH